MQDETHHCYYARKTANLSSDTGQERRSYFRLDRAFVAFFTFFTIRFFFIVAILKSPFHTVMHQIISATTIEGARIRDSEQDSLRYSCNSVASAQRFGRVSGDVRCVILEIPRSDILALGPPHAVKTLHVVDEVAERAHAERLTPDMRMNPDIH